MAGHSKWANIKHRKGAQDKKRSKIFTRLIKELTVATREAGSDPEGNARLRLAINKAKAANVPKDTIERAIKKGSGADGENYEELTYEGYAPHGVAVFVEVATDNVNRTVASLRSHFSKAGGSMANNGSVAFLFDRKGVFNIDASELKMDADTLELNLIDGGADEIELEEDMYYVTCPLEEYGNLNNKLEEIGIAPTSSELDRVPTTTVTLDLESAQKVLAMIDKLEDDEDVQAVFHNLEMTDELAEALS
jgi:YebC/PmpR family DNA-binding regulatory protein